MIPILFLLVGTMAKSIDQMGNSENREINTKIVSTVKQTIKTKKKSFKCTIKLVHDRYKVDLDKSLLKCSPAKPKKQKANNVLVYANGYTFRINVVINPSAITKATIIEAPTTTPLTTTPGTTPMETTTFSLPGTTMTGSGENCTCGQANRGQRIVNGEETEVNEYPWIGGLVSAGGGFVWCGATLISNQWVLTAAHCTDTAAPADIEILLGEHDYYDEEETITLRMQIADIFNHPKYNPETVDYDFSLLRLSDPVDFAMYPHIRPVCLPKDPTEDYDGFLATVAGWGATSEGGSTSNYLQSADVTVLSNEDCNGAEYAYGGAITDRMLCANVEGGGTDSCQGDSGGPLITPNPDLHELIGVVSWGYGCAQDYAPGVYARVTKVLSWISRTTSDSWSSCPRCEDPSDCPGEVVVGPVTENPGTVPTGSCMGSCAETESDNCAEGACIFPFIYNRRIVSSCTSIDGDPNTWCATQVDMSGQMVTWGHCQGDCPTSQQSVVNIHPDNAAGSCFCGVPNCETTDNATKIVGGTPACTGQYPWQVALLFFGSAGKDQACGGTLIGSKYVMTAAHCTDGLAPMDINVVVGDTDLGSLDDALSLTIGVKTIIQHASYTPSPPTNDIAILELEEEIDLFAYPNIKPACLPTQDKVYSGQDAVVSGWGTIFSGGPATSVLMEVGVTIFADDNCGAVTPEITDDMICAGVTEGGKDACQGDSGGPLVAADEDNNGAATLVGVVSWGYGCADADYPGVYAEVAHFLSWISDNTPDLDTCPAPTQSSWVPGEPCCSSNGSYTMPSPSSPLFSTPSWTGMSTSAFTEGPLPSTPFNCSCGQARRGNRIVNGEETEVNEFPWMAGLVSAWGDSVFCGATLIGSLWVMTAAHCTEGASPGDIEVLLGEHDYYDDTETVALRVKIARIYNHPGYDAGSIDNDFSLLRLTKHVDFDAHPHIRPACLPEDPAEDYEGFLATVSGWGTTSSGGQVSNYLQKAEVTVLSNEDCNSDQYVYGGAVTDKMMCANVQGGGTDSCQGDSGGPLVTPNPDFYELIGVVSWGYGCAEADAPGVYARMTTALQWIARTTAGSWMTCGRCEDPTDCPTQTFPSLPPVSTSPWPQSTPWNQNYTGSPATCCNYNYECLPLDTRQARPEKCDWVSCWGSEAGPTLEIYSEYDGTHCCVEDGMMYMDGDEMVDNTGNMVTCCKGRWMKPAGEDYSGEEPIIAG